MFQRLKHWLTKDTASETRMEQLEKQLNTVLAAMNGCTPMVVDLRLNGRIQPVLIFAKVLRPQEDSEPTNIVQFKPPEPHA